MDKSGAAWISLPKGSPEALHLTARSQCSLMVQPTAFPARAVAAVALLGSIDMMSSSEDQMYKLELDKALYFGGLDEVRGREGGHAGDDE